MAPLTKMQIWLKETRANFLILSVLLVMIGGAAGLRAGSFHPGVFVLTVIGVVLAHVSVNLFNEYSDWRTGIDQHTRKTPFSGGSGTLQAGHLKPGQVKAAAWGTLFGAFLIGLGLAFRSGWPVLALMAAGGLTTIYYTEHLTRWTLGELASGITLGSFVVLGAYYVQTGLFDSTIIWVSIPPGILTALLLFLNEFPDAEADRAGGRRHLVIVLGKPLAAKLYAFLLLAVYGVIAGGLAAGALPKGTLLAFLTFPVAIKAALLTLRYSTDIERMLPAQGMNVITVLATDFLLAAGLLIG
ncbi:MAG: UbiA family prenyltransferase [Candidatus Latescibacterota bacterium]